MIEEDSIKKFLRVAQWEASIFTPDKYCDSWEGYEAMGYRVVRCSLVSNGVLNKGDSFKS